MDKTRKFYKVIGIIATTALLLAAVSMGLVAAQADDVSPALQSGAERLVELQNGDGGWDWPLDNGDPTTSSPANTIGPIGKGLAEVYEMTGDPDQLAALEAAGFFLLAKTNNFSPPDGYLAAALDEILGGTTYSDHLMANFYTPLANGTYDRNGAGTLYSTTTYVDFIQNARSGSNLGLWDIGMGLVGAATVGADTTEWVLGVQDELNEFDSTLDWDVLGLAGGVFGLSFIDADFDPTAGDLAPASNLADLAAILATCQISSGGFSYTSQDLSEGNESVQETAYALLALDDFDPGTYQSEILAGADFLIDVQLATGGWGDGENNEVTGEALWAIQAAYELPLAEAWVCESGDCGHPGADFATIQGAVNAVDNGAQIYIMPGSYPVADTIILDKPLTLMGPVGDVAEVIGAGGDSVKVFEITSGDVSIQNLSITLDAQPANHDGMISIPDNAISNITIANNKIFVEQQPGEMSTWWARAIQVGRYVTNLTISQNEMYNTRTGLVIHYNSSATISDNVIYNTKGGIMNYTGSIEDYQNRVMQNNSWNDVHNEWDIVWNSGGGPYEQDYSESVLGVSQANNNAYVTSLMTTTETKTTLGGNRSHVFVDPSGVTEKNWSDGNMNVPFANLQLALHAVVDGGTIFVAPGTYIEEGQLVIDKNVTIIGADKETTIIKPAQSTGASGDARGWFLVNPGAEFNLSGVTLDGEGQQIYQAIRSYGAGIVENNIIKNMGYSQYYGFGAAVIDANMTFRDNTFENFQRVGVILFGSGTTNATIDNNVFTGKGPGDWLDYGVELGGGAVATITNNTITDCQGVASADGSASSAILATTYYGAGTGGTIEHNLMTGNANAIVVGYDETDTSDIVARYNQIVGNDNGVSTEIQFVDASPNWWGSADGPDTDQISGDVGYNPWCGNEECTELVVGPGGSIQKAIDLAEDGTLIRVLAGTYVEHLNIDKDVKILGASVSRASTIIQSPDSVPVCFSSSNDYRAIVCIEDANVELDGLTIDGLGKGNANNRFVGVAFHNAGGVLSNSEVLDIKDTPFSGTQHGLGIFGYFDDGERHILSITDNNVQGFQKNGVTFNSYNNTPVILDVIGNTIVGEGATDAIAQNGIQVQGYSVTATIANNVVRDIAYDNTNASTKWAATSILNFYANVTIENNLVSGGHVGLYNIDAPAKIQNNILSIEKVGVYAYGMIATDPPEVVPAGVDIAGEDGTVASTDRQTALTVEIKDNELSFVGDENADTFGIEADSGYGAENLSVLMSGNIIDGFDYGIAIYKGTSGDGIFTDVTAVDNCIYNSSSYGLLSNDDSLTVNAVNNFWGHATGPYHPTLNPLGKGAAVSEEGVAFDPWSSVCSKSVPKYNQNIFIPLFIGN